MILVDTSIWADHFRVVDPTLEQLLENEMVLCHPFVIGEIMMGNPKSRPLISKMLHQLQQATVARDAEVLEFVEMNTLFGLGIGYIDAHLLASVKLTDKAALWTRDKRMSAAAERLKIGATGVPKLQ